MCEGLKYEPIPLFFLSLQTLRNVITTDFKQLCHHIVVCGGSVLYLSKSHTQHHQDTGTGPE